MSSNSSGKRLEGFFTGKGFYIVLFLCAAVIGVSAWMLAAGNETMENELGAVGESSLNRVETIIIPPAEDETTQVINLDPPEVVFETAEEAPEAVEVFEESVIEVVATEPEYIWPVSGEIERGHDASRLMYDVTMRDWRTHEGIDILAPLGSTVTATRGGTVSSVEADDLYGTVVTVEHDDGSRAMYANLAELPAVNVNERIEQGYIIGAVGDTALCEVGQGTHLHFALTVNGESVDPLSVLGA